MLAWINAETFATLSIAALFGGMLFFSAVMAPLIFIKLPAPTSGRFIRAVFPWYYLAMGTLSLVALCLLLVADRAGLVPEWSLMLAVLGGFVIARQWLMPRINRARDAAIAGDSRQGIRFERLHRVSVGLNAVQLLIIVAVLIRLI
jgi:hypothetical protein